MAANKGGLALLSDWDVPFVGRRRRDILPLQVSLPPYKYSLFRFLLKVNVGGT